MNRLILDVLKYYSLYRVVIITIIISGLVMPTHPFSSALGNENADSNPSPSLQSPMSELYRKFQAFPWVTYAPTHFNPIVQPQVLPTEQDIREDLQALYDFGFRGIVTYSADGIFGDIPRIAREVGFEGVVMGIWSPGNASETANAIAAVADVDGYVVGNEGVFFERYGLDDVRGAIADLQAETNKPVTTTEVLALYDPTNENNVLGLGDWLFPNVHPYWAGVTQPERAFLWTQQEYQTLLQHTTADRPLVLKEVGLPSAGALDPTNTVHSDYYLSEHNQAEYYARLRNSDVVFVYFEAFDQPWKQEGDSQIGAHWGLFYADRTMKSETSFILGDNMPPLSVYSDANVHPVLFYPEGYMGCIENDKLKVNLEYRENPYAGETAIQVTLTKPLECQSGWAGVYWWTPAECNWYQKDCGIDLTGWTTLSFWARGETGTERAEFLIGGLCNAGRTDCDSLKNKLTTGVLSLSTQWTQYRISLQGQDLSRIAGAFAFVVVPGRSTSDVTIYIEEIRLE
jgi:exo-beta-1,3-glucanase (GH17 family)